MLLIKILFLLLLLLPAEGKWHRVKTEEKISFLLPDVPQKSQQIINGIPSTIYQAKNLTCIAGVVCSDFSSKKVDLTGATALLFYEELKKSTLDLESAIIKKEITVPYENMLIKEIEYSIIKDKHEMTYFKRFIFRNNYIYQISIGGRTRHMTVLRAERETFFNSISFPEDSENKN